MADDVAREVALSVCELFFAEGWLAFSSEERHDIVNRMANALRMAQLAATAASDGHGR